VLYFDDRSSDKSLRYLSDGLTEALIREIGQVKGLHVVSRNGVSQFKNQTPPIDSVASALSVGTIVSGTVTGAGDRLRVNVELTDARSGKTTSTEIEKTKQDAFALQDSLVREVSVFLRKQVGSNVQELQGKAGTRNAQAWDQFQRARQTVEQGDSLALAGSFSAAVPVLARADSALAAVQALDSKWVVPVSQRAHTAHRASRYALAARQMPAMMTYSHGCQITLRCPPGATKPPSKLAMVMMKPKRILKAPAPDQEDTTLRQRCLHGADMAGVTTASHKLGGGLSRIASLRVTRPWDSSMASIIAS